MNDLHRRLLEGGNIVGQLGDDYFIALADRIAADTDPMPQVVLEGQAAGRPVQVVDITVLGGTDDDPIRRGFLWVAVVGGPVELWEARRCGTSIPRCRIEGAGRQVASSNESAAAALDLAQQALLTEQALR